MDEVVSSLNVVDVAAPCTADWDTMTGDDRVRHCGQCEMNVYNLSEMSEADALNLVNEREGRMCVRFYRRADGTVLTNDCPVGLKAIRKAVRQKIASMWASTAALASAIFLGGLFGKTSRGEVPEVAPPLDVPVDMQVITGDICITPNKFPMVQLTLEGLKMMPAETVKGYLQRCLAKEEQGSYGMPDPDNKNALEESIRQAWQVKVDDASYLPKPGSKEHVELSKLTAELLKRHQDVAVQLFQPKIPKIHEAHLGRIMIRPRVFDPIAE